MGCDIHATLDYEPYTKKAIRKGVEKYRPYWRAFAKYIDIERNYTLFTILAGVRNASVRPVIALPRGVHEDASYEFKTELEDWGGDAHSMSYISWPEIRDWKPDPISIKDYEWDVTNFRDDDWYKVMEMLANKYGDDNVRLCFFFDN